MNFHDEGAKLGCNSSQSLAGRHGVDCFGCGDAYQGYSVKFPQADFLRVRTIQMADCFEPNHSSSASAHIDHVRSSMLLSNLVPRFSNQNKMNRRNNATVFGPIQRDLNQRAQNLEADE